MKIKIIIGAFVLALVGANVFQSSQLNNGNITLDKLLSISSANAEPGDLTWETVEDTGDGIYYECDCIGGVGCFWSWCDGTWFSTECYIDGPDEDCNPAFEVTVDYTNCTSTGNSC